MVDVITSELILGAAIVLLAGLIQGCTGFGFALVTVPVLVFFLPHEQIPPTVVLLSLVGNIIVIVKTRTSVKLRLVLPLVIGGIIGLPFGGYVLLHINEATFKIGVGIIVLVLSLIMLVGWRRRVRNETAGLVPVGILSGFLSGSTSIGGPPVILFFSNQGIEKDAFRANLVTYFALTNIGATLVFAAYGLLNREIFINAGAYLLPIIIGSFVGIRLARLINEDLFRKVVLTLVVLLGVVLVITNLHI